MYIYLMSMIITCWMTSLEHWEWTPVKFFFGSSKVIMVINNLIWYNMIVSVGYSAWRWRFFKIKYDRKCTLQRYLSSSVEVTGGWLSANMHKSTKRCWKMALPLSPGPWIRNISHRENIYKKRLSDKS